MSEVTKNIRSGILIFILLLVCIFDGCSRYKSLQKQLELEWKLDIVRLERDMLQLRLQRVSNERKH